jgi:hypothetical protein
MLFFGADIPLVEVIFVLLLVAFIVLVEVVIIVSLLLKQTNKSKQLVNLLEKLTDTILEIKKVEIAELDKLKRR